MEKKNQNIEKENKGIFSVSETIILVFVSLLIGLSIGMLYTKKGILSTELTSSDKNLNEFIKNYKYVVENYYGELDKEELINNAISGMMKSLDDPYSVFLDKEENDNLSLYLDGSYRGIGIQIVKDAENGYMFVAGVIKESPAEKAGIEPGDYIISANNKEAKDMTAAEFSDFIKNGADKEYTFKILRDKKEMDIKIDKSLVTLKSVLSKTYDVDGKKVGYIYIGIFANNTYRQFSDELDKLEKDKIDYLIIDVRSNTGGHLTAVDRILDIFLNSKQIMYQFEQAGKKTAVYATGKDNKKYEIILLGDTVSASASELLIAGLKENLGSKFIGTRTYGKGTVQELVTLSNGDQYKITVKKWLTPKGNWIKENEGIEPDIKVELDDNYYKTGEDSDDNQLQAALDYIKGKK